METKTIRVNDVWAYKGPVSTKIVKVIEVYDSSMPGKIGATIEYENGSKLSGHHLIKQFVEFKYNDTENTFRPVPESKYMDALVEFTRNPSAENEKKLRWAWYQETGNLVSAR